MIISKNEGLIFYKKKSAEFSISKKSAAGRIHEVQLQTVDLHGQSMQKESRQSSETPWLHIR